MADLVTTAEQLPAPRLTVLAQMPIQHKLALMVIAATAIALIVGGWIWSQTPDYRVLYANISDRDGGAVLAAIQQMNVPYKFADGGNTIMVPADKVADVRLRLAAQGLPKGSNEGFELLENPKIGTSQFLEQVNYQRALEGELARSIQSLSAVRAARVHLALTKPSVFVRNQQQPSASVLLSLYPGSTLEPSQVNAIIHLVASSVPDLPPKNVTVVDQNGNLLSASSNLSGANGLDANQLKYLHDIEHSYARRVEAILEPIVGPGNVRAEVTADVDFSQVERAEELYKPNGNNTDAAIRSQQTTESTSSAPGASGGVPGALSNQPPVTATAPLTTPAGTKTTKTSGKSGVLDMHKESTVNYEVDKTIQHVRQSVGGLKRLSVAVVVNYRKAKDAQGKVVYKPLPAAEMAQITALVKDATGYDKQRGDIINVVNAAFDVPEHVVVPPTPFWKKRETYLIAENIGKQLLIAAAVLYLVLGVLRPLIVRLITERPVPPAAYQAQGGEMGMQGGPRVASYEERLQVAQKLAQQEPKLVANVVKEWISGE